MKTITKLCLSLLIFLILFLMSFNFASKRVVTNTIAEKFLKDRYVSSILRATSQINTIDSQKKIELSKEVSKSPEIKKAALVYLNSTLKVLLTNNKINKVDISRNINKTIIDSKVLNESEKKKVLENISTINYNNAYSIGLSIVVSNISQKNYVYLRFYYYLDNIITKIIFVIILAASSIFLLKRGKTNNFLKIYLGVFALLGLVCLIIKYYIEHNMVRITRLFVNRVKIMDLIIVKNLAQIYFVIAIFILVVLIIKRIRRKKHVN